MKRAQTDKPSKDEAADVAPAAPESRQMNHLMVLMAGATEKPVLFETSAERDSRVYVAGTFNGWNPTSHPLTYHPSDDLFRATLLLPQGVHEYKFVVNGVWHVDVKCPNWVLNNNGTLNSVISV
jgi:1,4-alpha-glucan branching enzyme